MKTRPASTRTPAPPATISATPEAGAAARPFTITKRVAAAAVSAATMVDAAELVARRVQFDPKPSVTRHGAAPSSSAASTGSSRAAMPG